MHRVRLLTLTTALFASVVAVDDVVPSFAEGIDDVLITQDLADTPEGDWSIPGEPEGGDFLAQTTRRIVIPTASSSLG
jgi:hypothetical protein